jgi:hypothetical protein
MAMYTSVLRRVQARDDAAAEDESAAIGAG